MSKWKHFDISEFDCRCGCGGNEMNPKVITKLDRMRDVFGKRMRVTSGYRCPSHNNRISSTGFDGPHTTGDAADIGVDREDALKLLMISAAFKWQGVGVNQKGNGRFLHFDDCEHKPGRPRPTIWTY